MATFVTSGPIRVPTQSEGTRSKEVDMEKLKKLADTPAGESLGKPGCYIFSLGTTPWYVGKTTKSIIWRITHSVGGQGSHEGTMNKILNKRRGTKQQGKLYIWTVTSSSRGRTPSKEIGEIEKELTVFAANKNSKLFNRQGKEKIPNWSIKGVIRSTPGPREKNAKKFRTMIGLAPSKATVKNSKREIP